MRRLIHLCWIPLLLLALPLGALYYLAYTQGGLAVVAAALNGREEEVTVLPVSPTGQLLYKLQWYPARTQTAAAARFVQLALTVEVPPGWTTQPGHLRFDGSDSSS